MDKFYRPVRAFSWNCISYKNLQKFLVTFNSMYKPPKLIQTYTNLHKCLRVSTYLFNNLDDLHKLIWTHTNLYKLVRVSTNLYKFCMTLQIAENKKRFNVSKFAKKLIRVLLGQKKFFACTWWCPFYQDLKEKLVALLGHRCTLLLIGITFRFHSKYKLFLYF